MAKKAKGGATTALALQQARHYMRYMRADQGEKPEAIATSEGVSVAAVNKSIKMIQLHRTINTQTNLNTAVVGMLMTNLERADKTFQRLFKSKNYVERRNVDGSTQLVPVDDTETQLKAMEVFGKFIESMQPKASGSKLVLNNNNTANAQSVTNTKTGGYEEMLHGILDNARAHNELNPTHTADLEEFETEDDEDEDEDEEGITA